MSLSKLWETVKDKEAWHAVVHGACYSPRGRKESDMTERLNNKVHFPWKYTQMGMLSSRPSGLHGLRETQEGTGQAQKARGISGG